MSRCIFFALALCITQGCTTIASSSTEFKPGSILVLPPRDVVQNGSPHTAGKGSGEFFKRQLVYYIDATAFTSVENTNDQLGYSETISIQDGAKEAQKRQADYFLISVLGEFLNAAPMTFRPDYVYLESAALYKTGVNTPVWKSKPNQRLKKGNAGDHLTLLDKLAEMVANDIAK